ncbi:MAG: hypothetical protein AAGC74_01705 [Verrucomicrobiota bacterium]
MRATLILLLLGSLLNAQPALDLSSLGQSLGGWNSKSDRAATYQRSGSKYRTWKPEITPMPNGGIFLSVRIDHLRGTFASDDHASLTITVGPHGQIENASSSMAFQGRKITSDVIRLGGKATTTIAPIDQAAKVGTNLLADLTSKLLRENVVEPGRVSFHAVIHHNYNHLCLALSAPRPALPVPSDSPQNPTTPLQFPNQKSTTKHTGQTTALTPTKSTPNP